MISSEEITSTIAAVGAIAAAWISRSGNRESKRSREDIGERLDEVHAVTVDQQPPERVRNSGVQPPPEK